MPLDNTSENYVGKTLFVFPNEWSAWCRFDAGDSLNEPGKYMSLPEPFHFQLLEVIRFEGNIRAGIGLIAEDNHVENKHWLAFVIRDGAGTETHNFTTNPGNFNLSIGKKKPVIKIEPDILSMPQWMQFQDESFLSGFGYIELVPKA